MGILFSGPTSQYEDGGPGDPQDGKAGMTDIAGTAPGAPEQEKKTLRVALLVLYLHQSLGLRQISSVLRAAGHETHLIFFKEFRWGEFRDVTAREEELLVSTLREIHPDLIGINLTTTLVADLAYRLSDKLRAELGLPIIVGGAHVSAAPEEVLEHADFVCVGEGEEAVVELAEALAAGRPTDGIANIWTKVGGEIRRNEVRPLTQDIDRYPRVSYGEPESYFIEEDYLQRRDPTTDHDVYHTTAARMSCPFNCTFCAGVYLRRELYADKGPVRRYRSVGAILEELQEAGRRRPGLRTVQFWDEVFGAGAPKGWMEEFSRAIRSKSVCRSISGPTPR